ncbi:MAG: cation diffusion facilitator family transporter [Actinomycetota bacterium]
MKRSIDAHEPGQGHGYGHSHGTTDPLILSTRRGIQAVKWSLLVLLITGIVQVAVVLLSGSVALLADTIHNFGDAFTAVPLWIAFHLGRRRPTRRFTYGLGRLEDLAGVLIVLIILGSAAFAAYEAIDRILNPRDITNLWAVAVAAVVGFVGNEGVALFRVRVGREIGSAALVADGYHARVDGLTSLGVLAGAIGVWLGFRLADPIVGLIISAAILRIVWQSGRAVFIRLLDGVDPEVTGEIALTVSHVPGVREVTGVRVRWLGHRMHAELNLSVCADLTVEEGHDIAIEARHQLLHHLKYLSDATIHVDPEHASGGEFHCFGGHAHDDLPPHSH